MVVLFTRPTRSSNHLRLGRTFSQGRLADLTFYFMPPVCMKEQQEAGAGLQNQGSYFLPQIKKELRVFRT